MKVRANQAIIDDSLQKSLRRRMTDAENHLWRHLRRRQFAGCKFRRQHPFFDYILDFACLEKSLAIEVDAGQHQACEQDRQRDARLQAAGFRVLRFWNNQVLQETDAVLEAIWLALNENQSGRPRFSVEGDPAVEAASLASQHRPFPFKGKDRKGMGPRPADEPASVFKSPHPPPDLPLEGGGEGRTERSAP